MKKNSVKWKFGRIFFIKNNLNCQTLKVRDSYNTRKKEKQMRSRSIGCDVLISLLDFKIHTIKELSEKIEVSYSTVFRHIQDLSFKVPYTNNPWKKRLSRGGGRNTIKKQIFFRKNI